MVAFGLKHGYRSKALTLWPVYLCSGVQGDHVRLFELGDVVTLPVMLVDAAAEVGWLADVGVETAVTVSADGSGRRRWATTPAGLSVRAQLSPAGGTSIPIRAGLTVEFQTSALMSFVTGTVRRIEMASVASPELDDPGESVQSCERWTLTETPVSPVRFRDPFGPRRSESGIKACSSTWSCSSRTAAVPRSADCRRATRSTTPNGTYEQSRRITRR